MNMCIHSVVSYSLVSIRHPEGPRTVQRTMGSLEMVSPSGILSSWCSCPKAIGKKAAAKNRADIVDEESSLVCLVASEAIVEELGDIGGVSSISRPSAGVSEA